MDHELILELTNHNVYYVKTNIVNYYISTSAETNRKNQNHRNKPAVERF